MKTKIAVLHSDVMGFVGGGIGVCLWIVEALKNDYEVTLITYGQPLDTEELNNFYGTNLSQDEFHVTYLGLPTLLTKMMLLSNLRSVILAFAYRWIRKNSRQFDLVICTDDECDFGRRGIQYVHFPQRSAEFLSKSYGVRHPTLRRFFHILFCCISGFTKEGTSKNLSLVNSNWVAKFIKEGYGIEPKVVYPPIMIDSNPTPWEARENGFILIGRIEKVKQVFRVIEIIKGLKRNGYNVHLHIVGRGSGGYQKKVFALAKEDSSIFVEQWISRERLSELICSHKYGIHGYEYEHFGMAAAGHI